MNKEIKIEHHAFSDKPRVSVVIPSLDGKREGNLAWLIEDFKGQTVKDIEIIVVKNVSPQGKAINLGVEAAKSEILLIADDDSRLGSPHVIENLLKVLEEDSSVGMAGASSIVPPDANWLQRRASKEFPRYGVKVVDKTTVSDMAFHGCCVIPIKVFEKVGKEREDIVRGLDPDLRFRLRKNGYKTVLAANTWIYHPLPSTLKKFIKTFIRNGMGSAYCLKYQPGLAYETDEALEMTAFEPKTTFLFRIIRFPIRIMKAVVEFKFLRALGYVVYAGGFCYGILKYSFQRTKQNGA